MNSVVLEGRMVSKVYIDAGATVRALDRVDIAIKEAEYVAIVGPSGAGKSTLLHILGGLEKPSEGNIFFRGRDMLSMRKNSIYRLRNESLGFVFQFYHLISELSVWENILLPARIGKGRVSPADKSYAEGLVEKLGLGKRIHAFPYQLSGGEKQKAALARALINRPEVLFCDEPTGNLDISSAAVIRQVLKDVNRSNAAAVVLVTHNIELAAEAERVIHIKNGRIEEKPFPPRC